VTFVDFGEFEETLKKKIEEVQTLLLQKSNIKDVCALLDMKSNIEDVNKALAEVSEELQSRV
jgi:GTP-binding protein EngB required for normal cell division